MCACRPEIYYRGVTLAVLLHRLRLTTPSLLHLPFRRRIMAGSSSSAKPPRPPNAWILFRSDMVRVMPKPATGAAQQSVVSKAISKLWAEADPAIKHEYERRAEIRKQEHAEMYPDYRFQPVKKEDKERQKEEAKQAKERSRRSGRKDRGSNRLRTVTPTASTSAVTTAPFPYAIPHFYPLSSQPFHPAPHGPTPPMSAAPSPSPENSPLEVVSDDQGRFLPTDIRDRQQCLFASVVSDDQ